MMRWGALALVAAPLWGCSPPGVFACLDSAQCGAGTCEVTGFCSFPDAECPSGRRYGGFAGDGLANVCVDDANIATTGTSSTMASSSTTMSPPTTATVTTVPLTSGPETSSTGVIDATAGGTSDTSDATTTGPIVPDGIIAWWRLNDDPEDGVLDASGNVLEGVCDPCPPQDPGQTDGAYAFYKGEYVEIQHDALFENDAFSVATWARPDQIPDGGLRTIVAKPVGVSLWDSFELYFGTLDPAYRVVFGCATGTTNNIAVTPFDGLGEWTHIVGTYDGVSCRLYVNGVMQVEISGPDPAVEFDGHPVYIGADNDEGMIVNHFIGEIEDVRIYDRALTDEDVAELAAQ